MSLTNSQIAELLAMEAETATQPSQRALRRASRRALLWEEEVSVLLSENRSLTELAGVGPYISKLIQRWLDHPTSLVEPPGIRQHFLTWTEAQKALSTKRNWAEHLKGDLQMHTEWSDGEDSVETMANEGESRGYEFIGITDHSKGLKIAGGINEQQLGEQGKEISEVNAAFSRNGKRLQVLRSIEVNLSPKGDVDMDPASLNNLDIVVGCFHSALRKKEDQTDRYLAALRNPQVQILGHPRGRIYNFRLGLTAQWRRVFDQAADLDKAVEIDAYPDRQDLNVDLLRIAKESGCRISFGTDAHGSSQMRFIVFALAAAALAGIQSDRVLNFMSLDQLLGWVASVRERNDRKQRTA
jgi:histidinol phosphatase-like PHP family hydrolase